jgi:hypothetical protein
MRWIEPQPLEESLWQRASYVQKQRRQAGLMGLGDVVSGLPAVYVAAAAGLAVGWFLWGRK